MKRIKSRAKSVAKFIPSTILSLGHYDLDYSITLTDDDLSKYNIEDITYLKTYEDISFIIDNHYLWNKIQIETDNKMINMLLYLNKVSKDSKKSYIEFISYEKPIFYNDSVKSMLKTVNDFNFFFVNDYPINPESKKYFQLKIKYKNQETIFSFDKIEEEKNNKSDDGKKDDNENNNSDNAGNINKIEENKNNEKEETKEEKVEENKNNEKEETKEEKVEENKNNENTGFLKNSNNIFNNIKLDCANYNFFICSIEDTLIINPYEDFIEFITFIKLNFGSFISIEYGDVSGAFNDYNSMTLLNKIFLLTDIFLFDEKDALNIFNKHYEIITKENNKKNNNNDESKSLKENENKNILKEENKSKIQYQSNKNFNNIKKENSLNINNNTNNNKNNEKNMTEKDLFDYFKHTIACNGALSILNNKLAIFIDNYFSKVTFIEVPMNIKATILSYEIKPYPKLTHTTVDLVEFYRVNLRKNKDFFKSIFYGGMLNKISSLKKKSLGLEVLYSAYLTGHEILKRMLYVMANDVEITDNQNFYIVKLNNTDINDYVKKEFLNKKESKFVLDCTNLEKSKLKYYVPLFDYNLSEFFKNKLIQRELINKGFINSKGFINYDPVYRKGMGSPKKIVQRNNSNINQNKVSKRHFDSNLRNKVINYMPPTKFRLPAIQNSKINISNKNIQKLYDMLEKSSKGD